MFNSAYVEMSDETNTEKLDTNSQQKGNIIDQKETSNGQTEMDAGKSSAEKLTCPDTHTAQKIVAADNVFRIPQIPLLRLRAERPVEHIHFDKKWAAKKGQLHISH